MILYTKTNQIHRWIKTSKDNVNTERAKNIFDSVNLYYYNLMISEIFYDL